MFTLFTGSALPAEEVGVGKRLALVIANGHYPGNSSHADAASRDAHLLADELKRNQFEVDLVEDANKVEMRRDFVAFIAKISPRSTALIYFNGIGIQASGQSYLIPIDAQIQSEADVAREGTSIDAVLRVVSSWGADVKIVILDAARTNTYESRFRSFSAGLAELNMTEGTLALYAVAPGQVGPETSRMSGLFMNELLKQMRMPNLSAEDVFTHTRVGVLQSSNGTQIPWMTSALARNFYFAKPSASIEDGQTRSSPMPNAAGPRAEAQNSGGSMAPPAHQQGSGSSLPPPAHNDTGAKPPAATFRDCSDCPELIVLPSGHFEMGAGSTPYDKPVHRVTIPHPFAMSRYEITFRDWDLCFSDGGCKFRPDAPSQGSKEKPVVNVDWLDANEYVVWLSRKTGHKYRLPSEAEWEYGARGGTTSAFSWGTAVGTNMANCTDCQTGMAKDTLPVGHFPSNAFGLFDMAGNAAEWVEDCWHENYRGAPSDGSAWESENCAERVLRGGSFDSTSAYIKPFARFRYDADVRYYANGFRVVRDLS